MYGDTQADMVREKELGVLHLDLQVTLGLAWALETSRPNPSGTFTLTRPHLPQLAVPPNLFNSDTPW